MPQGRISFTFNIELLRKDMLNIRWSYGHWRWKETTLILTELSRLGIAMAADSAVTIIHDTGEISVRSDAAMKLKKIPYLGAGISCWGEGTISEMSTDKWLSRFIHSNSAITQLGIFAEELAIQLNKEVTPNARETSLGFHLAGFEDHQGVPTPSFYHIHDGPSQMLANRGIIVNPNRFNANPDIPPFLHQQLASNNKGYLVRNGDFRLYAMISESLTKLFEELRTEGIVIPHSQNLSDRAEYLIFWIRTMIELYRLSNLVPGIGGGIHYLTISSGGIQSEGIQHL